MSFIRPVEEHLINPMLVTEFFLVRRMIGDGSTGGGSTGVEVGDVFIRWQSGDTLLLGSGSVADMLALMNQLSTQLG